MKHFIFQKFNITHFLFLSYFIITTLRGLINLTKDTKDICSIFNYYYLCSFSDFVSIIPILIIVKRIKSSKINDNEETTEQSNKNDKYLIYVDQVVKNRKIILKKVYKIIIIVSLCEFFALYSKAIFFIIILKQNLSIKTFSISSVLIIDIIGQYVFNRIILNYLFYRYHYLSFFINIIFLIILGVMDIIEIKKTDNNPIVSLTYIFIRIISSLLYCIEYSFSKIIITYNSSSPYYFLFYRGIIVNIFVIIFSVVFIYVELPDENGNNSIVFTRFWKIYSNITDYILAIIVIILDFLHNANIFFIIDKFSSSHLALSLILGHLSDLFISIIFGNNLKVSDFFLRLIIFFILIIAAAIHNEFIILNFCGFQKHTKKFLEIEAEYDLSQGDLNILGEDYLNEIDIDDLKSEINIKELQNNNS